MNFWAPRPRRPRRRLGRPRLATAIAALILALLGGGYALKNRAPRTSAPSGGSEVGGLCGAPLKNGGTCRNRVADGGRCHLHR